MALLALTGCGKSLPTSVGITRELPVEPAFAAPVHVKPNPADREIVAAGRERAGRAKANDIIVCFVAWYRQVRATYGAAAAEAQASEISQDCAVDGDAAFVKRRDP